MSKPDKATLIKKLKVKGWNFSHEREFAENLFVGRFNYFLIVYSLFLTAGFANNFSRYKYGVFYLGALVLFACWLPLFRAFKKHDRIIAIVFEYKKDHPASIVESLMKLEAGYKKRFRASYWMGIYIPVICMGSMIITAILVHVGMLL